MKVVKNVEKAVDKTDKRALSQPNQAQSDKFKDAAREAECDEDEARWTERLKKVAKHEPEKPE